MTVQPSAGSEAFAAIAVAVGEDLAQLLTDKFPGVQIYVPLVASENHWLRVAIGDDAIARLIAFYGGSRVNVPMRQGRHNRVRELRRAGALTRAQIAIETGYSERHVYRILSERDDRQIDMFE